MRFCLCLLVWCSLAATSASASIFTPNGDIIGDLSAYRVKQGDNLYEIARRHDIGIVELLAANPGIDPWEPQEGTELILTTMHILPPVREGLVLNLSELRLFYFKDDTVMSFPIGIGRSGWQTPLGKTMIVKKRENPRWIPPAAIREENPELPAIIPPGPDNPLGAYALNLGWPGYAIHGTNRPYGVGKRSSHGCIRLYPEDIKIVFAEVSVGMPVTVIDTPYKLGWRDNILFLEVTPTQEQSDAIADYLVPQSMNIPELHTAITAFAGEKVQIDWYAVDEAVARRSGLPIAIGTKFDLMHFLREFF
jgi:L,D-transpeptidase ErfK/SrfK